MKKIQATAYKRTKPIKRRNSSTKRDSNYEKNAYKVVKKGLQNWRPQKKHGREQETKSH